MSKKQNWEEGFDKEFAWSEECLSLYNPRTKSYTSVGESIKFFIAKQIKSAQLEGIEMCIGEERFAIKGCKTSLPPEMIEAIGYNEKRAEIIELKEKLKQPTNK